MAEKIKFDGAAAHPENPLTSFVICSVCGKIHEFDYKSQISLRVAKHTKKNHADLCSGKVTIEGPAGISISDDDTAVSATIASHRPRLL